MHAGTGNILDVAVGNGRRFRGSISAAGSALASIASCRRRNLVSAPADARSGLVGCARGTERD